MDISPTNGPQGQKGEKISGRASRGSATITLMQLSVIPDLYADWLACILLCFCLVSGLEFKAPTQNVNSPR